MVELNIGDLLSFTPHQALGLLVEKQTTHDDQTIWTYLLRSPKRSDLSKHLVSVQQVHEFKIIDGIQTGRLQYYKAGTSKCQQ